MKLDRQFGEHYLVELIDCDPEKIKFIEQVSAILLNAAKKSKATVLKHFFHQFEPCGVSGVLLIAESHMSLHTWPEESYVAIDIFTCGEEMDAEIGIAELKTGFNAKKIKQNMIPRGF